MGSPRIGDGLRQAHCAAQPSPVALHTSWAVCPSGTLITSSKSSFSMLGGTRRRETVANRVAHPGYPSAEWEAKFPVPQFRQSPYSYPEVSVVYCCWETEQISGCFPHFGLILTISGNFEVCVCECVLVCICVCASAHVYMHLACRSDVFAFILTNGSAAPQVSHQLFP